MGWPILCVHSHGTPHGVANAVLLPHIMAYNAEFTGRQISPNCTGFGQYQAMVMPIEEARQAAAEAVAQLNRDVNIPARLRDIGMKYEDIDAWQPRQWRTSVQVETPRYLY